MTASHNFVTDVVNSRLVPGTVLQDRYRIVEQLGHGGMGAVYEALDQRLGISVALKETLSSEPSMRKQFEREAQMLAGMQHPALPRVSDHFVEGNRAFLVMQFIGGVDLARIISQQPGPFPRDQVIAWADQLLDALIYLHSRDRQVIHRDIKPHNLKLTATGQIALLDFGLAKAQPSDPSVTSSRAFFGYTRHYAPLEQIQDQRTDPRSDIYALGATLYHLLTGIKPPDALMRATAIVNGGPDPLKPANEIHKAVGPQIAAILNKAMAQKPEDRYATASEFREALRRIGRISSAPVGSAREVSHESGNTSARPAEAAALKMAMVVSAKRFGPEAVTAVLVLVVLVAGGILYGSQRWFDSPRAVAAEAGANTASVQRQPVATRKPERARPTDSSGVSAAKTRYVSNVTSDRSSEKKNEVAAPKSERVHGRKKESAGTEQRISPRVDAPSVRLPNLEFHENAPAPSPESQLRSYGSSASSPAAPKFFRASDGSQIVKFSDGSVRVVHPGARSARNDAYQQRAPKFFRASDGTQVVKFSDDSVRVVRPGARSARDDDYQQR
ncbi:MAG: serine/threonine protein kinase [Acidobacteriota bacterium]|nr:serine/threonine protein kinase [Acidobacteriota bacterium]